MDVACKTFDDRWTILMCGGFFFLITQGGVFRALVIWILNFITIWSYRLLVVILVYTGCGVIRIHSKKRLHLVKTRPPLVCETCYQPVKPQAKDSLIERLTEGEEPPSNSK